MTPHDLFLVIIRLFGLYSGIRALFYSVPQFVQAAQMTQGSALPWVIITTIVMIGFFLAFVFAAGPIVRGLRLTRGFELDMIQLDKLTGKTILQVGVVILGGLLIVENLAPMLTEGYRLIRASVSVNPADRLFTTRPDEIKMRFATNVLNLLVGWLLITNHDRLAKWLTPK